MKEFSSLSCLSYRPYVDALPPVQPRKFPCWKRFLDPRSRSLIDVHAFMLLNLRCRQVFLLEVRGPPSSSPSHLRLLKASSRGVPSSLGSSTTWFNLQGASFLSCMISLELVQQGPTQLGFSGVLVNEMERVRPSSMDYSTRGGLLSCFQYTLACLRLISRVPTTRPYSSKLTCSDLLLLWKNSTAKAVRVLVMCMKKGVLSNCCCCRLPRKFLSPPLVAVMSPTRCPAHCSGFSLSI